VVPERKGTAVGSPFPESAFSSLQDAAPQLNETARCAGADRVPIPYGRLDPDDTHRWSSPELEKPTHAFGKIA
jgi:hypothetical protein